MQKQAAFILSAREHFTPAILNEETCRLWILKEVHPKGAMCPNCGAAVTKGKALTTWENMGRVSCRSCFKCFTATTGTVLHGSKLDMQTLYALALLLSFEVPHAQVAQTLKISYNTVGNWENRLQVVGILSEPAS